MRVIRPGNPAKINPEYQHTCKRCDCVFVFKHSEIRTVTSQYQRDEDYTIKCPFCTYDVSVNLRSLKPIE